MGTYKTRHGIITIEGDAGMEETIQKTGEYMYEDIDVCLPYVEGTVIDVGAHVGLWTIPMSKKADTVIAIESLDTTFALLQKNVDANDAKNVELHNILLGNPEKKYSSGGATSSGSNHYLENGDVPGRTLDDLTREKVSFVKIDVEGMEPEVLAGAQRIIAESSPILLIEVNPRVLKKLGKKPSDISKYLTGYNFYRFSAIHGWCRMPYLMNSFYNFLAVPKKNNQPKSVSFAQYIVLRCLEKIQGT